MKTYAHSWCLLALLATTDLAHAQQPATKGEKSALLVGVRNYKYAQYLESNRAKKSDTAS
jgi:hypothetical protein